jgi:O-acetyl-ADP-ribose deacetylase (regulator of RNase III)
MSIIYKKSNLLNAEQTFILHGCNAAGVMGAGVAAAIKNRWPKAYTDYKDTYNSCGLELGSIIWSAQPDGKTILHGITQKTYGRQGVHVSYWAVTQIFSSLNGIIVDQQVAMPKIGAGLAGGDWDVIAAIIENCVKTYQPVVYYI